MTLRVRLSIVPFGDESQEREIHQINISNLGEMDALERDVYGVEVDKYEKGNYDLYLPHQRADGAMKLVADALDTYLTSEDV